MSFVCPACKRTILNRRLKICSYCGATLPEEFLFTPDEIAVLKKEEKEQEAIAAARRKAADEAEKAKKAAAAGGYHPPPFLGC